MWPCVRYALSREHCPRPTQPERGCHAPSGPVKTHRGKMI
jgi:hypothetical protein